MNSESIGEFIQNVRKEKGLTQKDLADSIGVSDKTVSKWENGNSVPDTTLLKPLCDALDINVNELLSGKKLPPEDYSKNAEINMIALIKDNQKAHKTSILQNSVGVFLLISAVALMFATMRIEVSRYLDIFAFLVPACICVGVVLLTSHRGKKDILGTLEKTVIPAGVVSAMVQAIGILWNMSNPDFLGPNLSIVILTILYSVIAYLIVLVIDKRSNWA